MNMVLAGGSMTTSAERRVQRLQELLARVDELNRRPGSPAEGETARIIAERLRAELRSVEKEFLRVPLPENARKVVRPGSTPPLPSDDGLRVMADLPPGPIDIDFGWAPPNGVSSPSGVAAIHPGVLRLSPTRSAVEWGIFHLLVSRTADRVWVAGSDGLVRCYDLNDAKQLWVGRASLSPGESVGGIFENDGALDVTLVTDGFRFFTFDPHGIVAVPRRVRVDPLVRKDPGSSGPPLEYGGLKAISLSNAQHWLATAWGDGNVWITEMETLNTWQVPNVSHVRAIAFAPDGDLLAIGTNEHIALFSVRYRSVVVAQREPDSLRVDVTNSRAGCEWFG
jgi:hypothetical protein